MRICLFNRSYWPDVTATGQLLTELAEDLANQHGCEVSVVAGLPREPGHRPTTGWSPIRWERHAGVHIVRACGTTFAPRGFAPRAVNYLSYFLSACLAAFRVPRADIVVALTDPPIIGLAALVAARRSGAKFVFVCEDLFPEVGRLLDDFHSDLVDRCLDRVGRFLIRKADAVVALGETMKRRLVEEKGADPEKVVVIENWADCSRIVPRPKRNAFSTATGLADKFVVMHSGNIGLSQELDVLLDAAHHLRHYPDIVVALVGEGARRAALEERVRAEQLSNVRFFPFQSKLDLSDSFATADAFVISLKRGLAGCIVPSKLYGILAAGRPYVAAVEEACEVAAVTTRYDCGVLAEPGNAVDLARQIVALYRDGVRAARLGENGRRAALVFDRPAKVRAYHDLFRKLAKLRLKQPSEDRGLSRWLRFATSRAAAKAAAPKTASKAH